MRKQWEQWQTLFSWAPKSLQMVTAAMKLKDVCSLEEKLWAILDSILKNRDITLPTKVRIVKAMVFPVVMYGCTWKLSAEELMLLNCGVGEDSWESLLCKEIQPVHPKGNQSWIFFERTDAEAETLILWPPDVKNWLTGKDPDAGKDWRQKEKGMTEDEMVGWHHQLSGHEFEQSLGESGGQRNPACCSPWGHKESDTT